MFHTIGFGTEFDRQTGVDVRNTGLYPNGNAALAANPFDPTYSGPVTFIHNFVANPAIGVTSPDSNSKYALNVQSAYVRDQIDITRWVQLIAGVRYDRFDLTATDQNTFTQRNRVNNKDSRRRRP